MAVAIVVSIVTGTTIPKSNTIMANTVDPESCDPPLGMGNVSSGASALRQILAATQELSIIPRGKIGDPAYFVLLPTIIWNLAMQT